MSDDTKQLLTRKRRAYFDALGEEAVLSDLDNRKYEPELYGAAIQWLNERRESGTRRTLMHARFLEILLVLAAVSIIGLVFVAIALS